MRLETGKKLNYFFYAILIIILTSINNYNFNFQNTFKIENLEVSGFSKEKNNILKNEIKNILGKNILFIEKKEFVKLNNRNDIKELSIKKIFPKKILIHFIPAKPICIIKIQSDIFLLGDNGKILDYDIIDNNMPTVEGSTNVDNIFKLINLLKSSKIDYSKISNISFFKSGRFDIILKNEVVIKFPIKYSLELFNYVSDLFNDEKFVNSKIIDLRVKNRIIKYE
tara:strand:+ start:74 stop:748 length:675 start_codon:yes stop_codon:yes gene_type:complete